MVQFVICFEEFRNMILVFKWRSCLAKRLESGRIFDIFIFEWDLNLVSLLGILQLEFLFFSDPDLGMIYFLVIGKARILRRTQILFFFIWKRIKEQNNRPIIIGRVVCWFLMPNCIYFLGKKNVTLEFLVTCHIFRFVYNFVVLMSLCWSIHLHLSILIWFLHLHFSILIWLCE